MSQAVSGWGLVLVSFEVILGRNLAKCLKFKGYRSNSPVLRNGQDLGLTFRRGHNILCLLSIVTSVTLSKTAVFGVAFGFPLGPAHIGFPEPNMAASFTQYAASFKQHIVGRSSVGSPFPLAVAFPPTE